MSIKQGLVCGLVVCLALDAVPARVWAAEPHAPADAAATAPLAPASIDFHAAVRDAVAKLNPPSATATPVARASAQPSASLAAARSAVRRQGGGKSGLIIGLVTTVASIGATVYMLKQLKKDEPTPQNPQ